MTEELSPLLEGWLLWGGDLEKISDQEVRGVLKEFSFDSVRSVRATV